MLTLVDAMADPQLLAPLFPGPTWARWVVFLKTVYGLPMTAAEVRLYRHHTGRQRPPTKPAREVFCLVGRRGGKDSVIGKALVPWHAAFAVPKLAVGEVGRVACVATDRAQARVLFDYVVAAFDAVPMLRQEVVSRTASSLTLKNGVVVEIHSCSWRGTRGYSLVAAACDECSFWRSDSAASPDTEVLAALRPALSTTRGPLVCISTPYSRKGVMWKAFREHWGKDGDPVLVWRGTSLEMNPTLDPAVVNAALAEDESAARAEYLAEFRSDLEAFVSRETVDAAVVPGRRELPRLTGIQYRAFCDAAGGSGQDSMTLAISHAEQDRVILDCVREVRPPFSPAKVVVDFVAVLKSYGVTRVTGDRYAGDWPREAFQKAGITYEASERTKSEIYGAFLPALNSGRVELLDDARLAAQLLGLERRTTRGGRDSIDHGPVNGHDDAINAAAGALVLAAQPAGSGEVRAIGLSREPRRLGLSLVGDAPGIVDVSYQTEWLTERTRCRPFPELD